MSDPLTIICDRCGGVLDAMGGLFFTPPSPLGGVVKLHLCVRCASAVYDEIVTPTASAPDPDAPHPNAWRNDDDPLGVWWLGGEFVQGLSDDEWEVSVHGEMWTEPSGRNDHVRRFTCLVRRRVPVQPETVTVELPRGVVEDFAKGTADSLTVRDLGLVDACRKALAEDCES